MAEAVLKMTEIVTKECAPLSNWFVEDVNEAGSVCYVIKWLCSL